MAKNSIWITGASGRLGTALVKLLSANVDNKVVATDKDVDITDNHEVMQAAEVYRPNIIINCASISDEKYCEENMVEAFKVNALGARNLATAARHVNAKIIQLSTDDIFAGNTAGPRTEFDIPCPTTVYGKSKLAAENYVKELNPKHLIVRSSWVYGLGQNDYFAKVCEYGKNNESFDAAADYYGTPTSAFELAKCIEKIMDESEYGIFHASCEGSCSRASFAKTILEDMGYDKSLVNPIITNDNNSVSSTVLENLMLKMTDIYEMPDWESAFDDFIKSVR